MEQELTPHQKDIARREKRRETFKSSSLVERFESYGGRVKADSLKNEGTAALFAVAEYISDAILELAPQSSESSEEAKSSSPELEEAVSRVTHSCEILLKEIQDLSKKVEAIGDSSSSLRLELESANKAHSVLKQSLEAEISYLKSQIELLKSK